MAGSGILRQELRAAMDEGARPEGRVTHFYTARVAGCDGLCGHFGVETGAPHLPPGFYSAFFSYVPDRQMYVM